MVTDILKFAQGMRVKLLPEYNHPREVEEYIPSSNEIKYRKKRKQRNKISKISRKRNR